MPDDRLAYVDTSAFLKLTLPEEESDALEAALRPWRLTASALLEVEATLGVRRRAPDRVDQLRAMLSGVETIEIDQEIRRTARELDPRLRSLDAIHLATALSLGDRCDTFYAYDARLLDAARAHGLPVSAPA